MSSDLIFHPVSKRNWNEFNRGGYFRPEGSKYQDGIVCLPSDQLKKNINENFKGRRQVLVLIIDKSRLISKVHVDKEKDVFIVEEKLNMDAILDKIYVKPNEKGIFDIQVTEE